MLDIIIVGAGGLGREALGYARDALDPHHYRIKGFLDDDAGKRRRLSSLDMPFDIIGTPHSYQVLPSDRFLVAVGEPSVRRSLAAAIAGKGGQFLTLVHPKAHVARSARLSEGCIVAPFATIGEGVWLDAHVVLTFYSSAGHDAQIGACTTFSPYSVANGESHLGEGVFLGSHAVVNPGKLVGAYAKLAAGAVVYHDIPANTLATGNPATARPVLWGNAG